MDQILSFLAIPLGSVEKLFQGNSGLGCIDKLYHGLQTFDSVDFMSGKNMLEDTKLDPQYNVNKQMLPICAVMHPSRLYLRYSNKRDPSPTCYLTTVHTDDDDVEVDDDDVEVDDDDDDDDDGDDDDEDGGGGDGDGDMHSSESSLAVNLWDPKSPSTKSSYGYVKRPMMYMVSDDLSAKPFTSGLVLSCSNESKVFELDLEEKTICIGVQEVFIYVCI